jgi:hypothetical protein
MRKKGAESMKKEVEEETRGDFRAYHAYNSDTPEFGRVGI